MRVYKKATMNNQGTNKFIANPVLPTPWTTVEKTNMWRSSPPSFNDTLNRKKQRSPLNKVQAVVSLFFSYFLEERTGGKVFKTPAFWKPYCC